MRLDLPDIYVNEYSQLLDDYESKRASKFVMMKDRKRYITAHGQIRLILSSYLGIDAKDLKIKQGNGQKPKLEGESIFFNLSHSEDYALLAVSSTGEVGIDIECKRADVNLHSVGKSVFSSFEYHSLCELNVSKQNEAFFKCWTKKEAFIKAIGRGFEYDTKSFTVSTNPDTPAKFLFFDKNDYDVSQWNLVSFQPFENTYAALAFSFKLAMLRHIGFDYTLISRSKLITQMDNFANYGLSVPR